MYKRQEHIALLEDVLVGVQRYILRDQEEGTLGQLALGCKGAGHHIDCLLYTSVLASVSLFYAVSHWNSYVNAMLYINNADMEVITIVLRRLVFLTTQVAEDSTRCV